MMFNKVIEEQELPADKIINNRKAIRAIVLRNDNILLVHSNKGYYKFPGGGVEESESDSACLIREIAEETGYINCMMKDKFGSVIERKRDEYEHDALFQMTSHYYFCELVDDEQIPQALDDYELEEEFRPIWVSLNEALEQNEKIMKTLEGDKNGWLQREIFVLKKVLSILSD